MKSAQAKYFCSEPWVGLFSIEISKDVVFCPCFLKMKIGNLKQNTMQEVWNSEELIQLRRSFSKGELPTACRGQLCPVALGSGPADPSFPELVTAPDSPQ